MNPKTLLVGIVILLFLGGCAKAPETQAQQNQTEQQELPEPEQAVNESVQEEPAEEPGNKAFIEIKNLRFIPADITVPVGTTVIWQHRDQFKEEVQHKITVYSTNPPGVSPLMKYGDNYSYTFTEPKKHKYVSVIFKESMIGTVTVTE